MKVRVTTSDIARAAGVHQTTVSLALRNDPRLRASTVQRIKEIAAQLGYVPDPMLAALASYRRSRRPSGQHGALAWVTAWPTRDGWRTNEMFKYFFSGARRRAQAMGYRLEEFWTKEKGLSPHRLSEILYARGMLGLILAPQPDGVSTMDLDWSRFSVVTIGPTLRQPAFHQVSNDQFHTVMRLCESLAQRGFRRIGYSIERAVDDRMDGQWSAAYDRFHRDLPKERRVPRHEEAPAPATLRPWLRLNRPDVVISCADRPVRGYLAKLAPQLRQRTASALIGVAQPIPDCLGMHEDPENVGATAVEKIVGLIHIGERGIPAIASRTLIESSLFEPQNRASLPS